MSDNQTFLDLIRDYSLWSDYLGTFAFAVSGIRVAEEHQLDWFGAYVVGFITAVGGGTLRDMMLGIPVFWFSNPMYLMITLLALLTYAVFRRYLLKVEHVVFFLDSVGLGMFAVVGAQRSIDAGMAIWIAPLMATITGAFGGMIRDILVNEIPHIFVREVYASACLMGGLVYIFLFSFTPLSVPFIGLFVSLLVLSIRLLAIRYKWTLPGFAPMIRL